MMLGASKIHSCQNMTPEFFTGHLGKSLNSYIKNLLACVLNLQRLFLPHVDNKHKQLTLPLQK